MATKEGIDTIRGPTPPGNGEVRQPYVTARTRDGVGGGDTPTRRVAPRGMGTGRMCNPKRAERLIRGFALVFNLLLIQTKRCI